MTEPIAFVTTRHRCPFCRKSWAHRATALNHMTVCFADPARLTCKTCKHDEPPSGSGEPWDPFDPGGCAVGATQGPSCARCGEHPEVCQGHWPDSAPVARRLAVLCPKWEARDS